MKRTYSKILRNRKRRIERRLGRRHYTDQPEPILGGSNIHYEISAKTQAHAYGGMGAMHTLAQRIGLVQDLDEHLELLKVHLPYHESDHVLNFAYNILAGGVRLEDMELRRQDESFLNGLGAQRLPDPTTAGDFTRRFTEADIKTLMDCINRARLRVWAQQPKDFLAEAYVDVDGTLAGTWGECKGGMSLSRKGIWGYHPLIVSLANTKEVLYLVNRPGNVTSHHDSVSWIDRAIALLQPVAGQITLRGDTDFSHTAQLDRWDEQGVKFIVGLDAHPKGVALAQGLAESAWQPLERKPKYEIATEPRHKPERIKEQIVKKKKYLNQVLIGEAVAELPYQPYQCQRAYRLVIVRKQISLRRGEREVGQKIRYFFYLSNRRDWTLAQAVERANGRCDQENVVEPLKNGVNAMRMPVDNLVSNWAYMVMVALAWNLKAWFGLLMPRRERGLEIVRMEFRRFLQTLMWVPCQIVRQGRRIIYRLLGYNRWRSDFLRTFARISALSGP